MPGCKNILEVNSKLVYFFVCILFMWCQKLNVSCMVVFRDGGAFELTREMLRREIRNIPYPTRQCFLRLCNSTHFIRPFAFS